MSYNCVYLISRVYIAVLCLWPTEKQPMFSLEGSRPHIFTWPATHDLLCDMPSTPTHLSEELLQEGGGPAVVEVPAFGRVADVCCVQQQGQGFGLVNAVKETISK